MVFCYSTGISRILALPKANIVKPRMTCSNVPNPGSRGGVVLEMAPRDIQMARAHLSHSQSTGPARVGWCLASDAHWWAGFGNVASWESAFRFPQGRTAIDLPPPFNNTSFPRTSPRMNYGKKDEDADTGLVKIDRTQVFQEGEHSESESTWRWAEKMPCTLQLSNSEANRRRQSAQLDSSTAPRSSRDDAESSSPRSLSSSTRARSSRPTRPRRSSSASRSSSRTRMPVSARWSTW